MWEKCSGKGKVAVKEEEGMIFATRPSQTKRRSQGMKQDRWRGTATDRVPNMAILKMKLESWKGSTPKRNGYVSLGKDLKSMSEGQRWHIHALIVSPLLK